MRASGLNLGTEWGSDIIRYLHGHTQSSQNSIKTALFLSQVTFI